MNWVIIAAGGRGERANLGFNKIFAKLGRFPVIYWTLAAFEKSKVIDKMIISARGGDIEKIKKIIKKFGFSKIIDVVVAGGSRQESTFSILKKFKSKIKNDDLVGVHNAVNPFVKNREIREVFKGAKQNKAALLAQKARDTVKISNKLGFVVETPLRQYSWYAQTPQVATFEVLYKAHFLASGEKFEGTDDAQLVERSGVKPKIISCSSANFKITFGEDLSAAEQILKKWNE